MPFSRECRMCVSVDSFYTCSTLFHTFKIAWLGIVITLIIDNQDVKNLFMVLARPLHYN